MFRGGPSGGPSPGTKEGGSDQVLRLLEATVFTRELTPITEDMVSSLVACVFGGIREHLTQTIELKFNCFFLMPFVDEFPSALRMDIESAYDEHLEDVFDVASVKKQLLAQEAGLPPYTPSAPPSRPSAPLRCRTSLNGKVQTIGALLEVPCLPECSAHRVPARGTPLLRGPTV